jgi:hypothetical protein
MHTVVKIKRIFANLLFLISDFLKNKKLNKNAKEIGTKAIVPKGK